MLVSLASIAVNYAAAYGLAKRGGLGHAGLALSTALVALFGAVVLLVLLDRRVEGLHLGKLGASAGKIAAAAALMGVACRLSSGAMGALAGAGRTARLADVAISIPLGAVVFYAVARGLRVEELEAVRAACYTALRNAPRPETGDPPTGNR
jgi:putative peptidoglycan lipid II flippase